MDVSEVITEYGAYYENSGQNQERVKTLMLQSFKTYQYMTPLKTNDTIYKMAKAVIGDLLQAYKNKFSPSQNAKITPNPIPLYKIKIDDSVNPDDVEATWLGFLASESTDRKTWPFVRWYIEQLLMPRAQKDMETAIFNAVRVEPDLNTETPGAVLEIMNGLKYQLQQGIGNGLNRIHLNTLTVNNIFDEVESFRSQISDLYQDENMNYFMSKKWADAYKADKRSNFPYYPQDDYSKVDFSPHSVIGLPSMSGSNIIWATPKDNLLYITKKDKNLTKFKLEENKRVVDFLGDSYVGVGFGIFEAVFAYIPTDEAGSGSGS